MILHVTRATYLQDYRIHLWFNDSTEGEVDLENSLTGKIFEPLRDLEFFRQFQLEGHTLAWSNGADFAPEYLHQLAQATTSV